MKVKECPECKGTVERNERYDAYACLKCDMWLEDCCDDLDCGYCLKRSNKPSDMDNISTVDKG